MLSTLKKARYAHIRTQGIGKRLQTANVRTLSKYCHSQKDVFVPYLPSFFLNSLELRCHGACIDLHLHNLESTDTLRTITK
jgi:hypothetical protein